MEAARNTIMNQIREVFKPYGISVDYRHLSLIADFMTFQGQYRPFNRIGMEESSSPFLKMSFETTMQYLTSSCMQNLFDDNSTPSANIILGQVPKIGTGAFDLMFDESVGA